MKKARKTGRLVLFADGSINAAASDARRAQATDPDQQFRSTARARGEESPGSSGTAGGFTGPGDSTSYLKVRTALTVYQAQGPGTFETTFAATENRALWTPPDCKGSVGSASEITVADV